MSGIVSLSEAASIGLHACLLLARAEGRMLQTRQMAETLGVSAAHLAKVLQRLGRSGLSEAVRGPRGGSCLARPAAEITLLEIYEAIEGPLTPLACLLSRPVCTGDSCCLLGTLLGKLNTAVGDYLSSTTLAQACRGIPEHAVQDN